MTLNNLAWKGWPFRLLTLSEKVHRRLLRKVALDPALTAEADLVVVPGALGDVLIASGFLADLKVRRRRPLWFMTRRANFPLVQDHPALDGVVEFLDHALTWQDQFARLYQPTVPLQRAPHWFMKGRTLYQMYGDQLEAEWLPRRWVPQEGLDDLALPKQFITLHTTSEASKTYRRFGEVVAPLPWPVVLIGGPTDQAVPEVALDLRGRLSLRRSWAVMHRAVGHLGIDSFPAHVATSMEKPQVLLYSGQHGRLCEPPGPVTALYPPAGLALQPDREAQYADQLQTISPQGVVEAVVARFGGAL